MAKKKINSVSERKRYHEQRVSDLKISEKKRAYSRHWLDGFNDPYVENNYLAITREIAKRKVDLVPHSNYDMILTASKNGYEAKLKQKALNK